MVNALATVSDETGVLFLPVGTPYDRDVLFEHLQAAVRVHRRARLEIEQQPLLTGARGEEAWRCTECARAVRPGIVQYTSGARTLCMRCARRVLHDPQSAA